MSSFVRCGLRIVQVGLAAAGLGLGLRGVAASAAGAPAQVDTIELRQTDASLRETYAKGKRIGLPRMVMFDDQQRLIYGQPGLSADLPQKLHAALKNDRPIGAPITLDAVLAEVEDSNGHPLPVSSLPHADLYVVDYWAEWCTPCRQMTHLIDVTLKRWDGVHSVWLKVESDPEKLPEHRKK